MPLYAEHCTSDVVEESPDWNALSYQSGSGHWVSESIWPTVKHFAVSINDV